MSIVECFRVERAVPWKGLLFPVVVAERGCTRAALRRAIWMLRRGLAPTVAVAEGYDAVAPGMPFKGAVLTRVGNHVKAAVAEPSRRTFMGPVEEWEVERDGVLLMPYYDHEKEVFRAYAVKEVTVPLNESAVGKIAAAMDEAEEAAEEMGYLLFAKSRATAGPGGAAPR